MPLGLHARAAARFVHIASAFSRRIRVARGGREIDGKSIMGLLLLAAAQGSVITITASGPDEADALAGALRAGPARLRRGAMRLNGLGVSPGIGVGKALVLKRGARDLQFRVPASLVERELERLEERGPGRASRSSRSKTRIAETTGASTAYLFDAQLLMLDDAMLVERARRSSSDERLNAASALQRALEQISALFDRGPRTATCASERETSPTSSVASA